MMKTSADASASEKPFVVSEGHVAVRWGGHPTSSHQTRFRCFLCGHRFAVGDKVRLVRGSLLGLAGDNPFVCSTCDGEDIIERCRAHQDEGKRRFWWMGR